MGTHELLAKTQTHGQCFLLQKVVRNRKHEHKITQKVDSIQAIMHF